MLPELLLQPSTSALMPTYVSSINQVLPSSKGSLFLLGDKCISFVPKDIHQLYMFDGCYSCDSCQKLWEIQQALHQTGNLISLLKDCQLYYDTTVATFITQMQNQNTQFRAQMPQCVYNSQLQDQVKTYKAVKLLYQYKAVVAMWNYLAQKPKSSVYITQALQQYSGFTVQAKQALDLCINSGASNTVQLTINITLESGQTSQYLQQLGLRRGCYVQYIPQSTYIVEGKDVDVYNTFSGQLQPVVEYKSSSATQHTIHFTYNPQTAAQTVVSAGVKLLPVITRDKQCPFKLTLQQFTQYRKALSQFNAQDQLAQNVWRIQITWKYYNAQQELIQQTQTRLYTTAFTRTPM